MDQTERAFQKQPTIFLAKKFGAGKKIKRSDVRYSKSIGLGFKTPQAAIDGKYVDKKCPFTGAVTVRGRIIKGVVSTTKMNRTITVRRDYLHFIKKYARFEKRHKKISAHCSPAFLVRPGDQVTIGQTRPLSKTVSFTVIKHDPAGDAGKKGFSGF